MAGLPLPKVSPEDEKREERRKTLHEVVELAAKFFEESLQARTGARARGYLADRGVAPETIAQFRIGYAPAERFALKEYLGARKIPVEDMVEAGLLISGEDIPLPFDRFRERVMFPIHDFKGRVVGFGGRALGDVEPKYLNSPETPLFHKGWLLYNGARRTQGRARWRAADRGRRLHGRDRDECRGLRRDGRAARHRAYGRPARHCSGASLMSRSSASTATRPARARPSAPSSSRSPRLRREKFALRRAAGRSGPGRSDQERGGAEAMSEVLGKARPLAEMLWVRETAEASLDTPERRAALEQRLGEVLRGIGDETVRRYYRDDLQARLQRLFAPAARDANVRPFGGVRTRSRPLAAPPRTGLGGVGARSSQFAQRSVAHRTQSGAPPREALILLAALHHPWLLTEHAEELSELDFAHRDSDGLRRALLDAAAADAAGDPETLAAFVERAGATEIVRRMDRAITHKGDWAMRPGAAREDVLTFWHQIMSLHRKKRTLSRELREAERALGADPTEANFARLKDVQERLAVLDGTEALIEGFGALSGRPARTM